MTAPPPPCADCGHPLDRIDHYGILHTILDSHVVYRDVGIDDGDGAGGPGIASEIQLRCGYCGAEVPLEDRHYFYRRWAPVLEATARIERGE